MMTNGKTFLFSTLPTVAAAALVGGLALFGTTAIAGEKTDRLPIAVASEGVCDHAILGSIADECVQERVEGAVIQKVQTTTIEWRDEDAAISTLVRVPVVDLAEAGAAVE
ncbi:MAG: hypothetical protein AAGF59_11475 [Pseudomonadota bacterium]